MSNHSGRRTVISTSQSSEVARTSVTLAKPNSASRTRKRIKTDRSSMAKLAGYSAVFLLFASVVALGYEKPQAAHSKLNQSVSSNGLATINRTTTADAPSVDEIVSTSVAATLTEQANLPVAPMIANTAVSLAAKSELAQADDSSTAKPQIVHTDGDGRSVQQYTAVAGDSVPLLASRFGISADTIKWANNLTGDAIEPGKQLTILPVDGVRHTVKSGETAESLAQKYSGDATRIISYNDLELSGIVEGQVIVIPGGALPESERPGYRAPVRASGQYSGSTGSRLANNFSASAGNRYAPGNCTWYVFERRAKLGRPIGSFWGNANTWAYSARAAGFTVNNTPAPGSILVDRAGYYGHVAVVESVLPNGDVYLTEMNNYAYGGFNIVNDRTISAGQAASYQYVH